MGLYLPIFTFLVVLVKVWYHYYFDRQNFFQNVRTFRTQCGYCAFAFGCTCCVVSCIFLVVLFQLVFIWTYPVAPTIVPFPANQIQIDEPIESVVATFQEDFNYHNGDFQLPYINNEQTLADLITYGTSKVVPYAIVCCF